MITVRKTERMSVSPTNGSHEIISDVARDQGGQDEGLNPHELLESSLAACTLLTLELYANRKKWDLTGLIVEVSIAQEGPESIIDRKITFGEQNSVEEKMRLLEIANKCPIHKILEGSIRIETKPLN